MFFITTLLHSHTFTPLYPCQSQSSILQYHDSISAICLLQKTEFLLWEIQEMFIKLNCPFSIFQQRQMKPNHLNSSTSLVTESRAPFYFGRYEIRFALICGCLSIFVQNVFVTYLNEMWVIKMYSQLSSNRQEHSSRAPGRSQRNGDE